MNESIDYIPMLQAMFNCARNTPLTIIAAEYTNLEKEGEYLAARCPFEDCAQNDANLSFKVNPEKNIFFCFACERGGDVITFLCEKNNKSPIDVVTELMK